MTSPPPPPPPPHPVFPVICLPSASPLCQLISFLRAIHLYFLAICPPCSHLGLWFLRASAFILTSQFNCSGVYVFVVVMFLSHMCMYFCPTSGVLLKTVLKLSLLCSCVVLLNLRSGLCSVFYTTLTEASCICVHLSNCSILCWCPPV